MIDVSISRIPPTLTAQQKGVNHKTRRIYTKEEVRQLRHEFALMMAPHRPEKAINEACVLDVVWAFPYPEATPDKGRLPFTPKHTKPDAGNLTKLLADAMEDVGFFTNDSRIARECTTKGWAPSPYIRVRLFTWRERYGSPNAAP